jgi:excisionase family DNA binding protein
VTIEDAIRAAVAEEVAPLRADLARVEEKLAAVARAAPLTLVDVPEAARRLGLSESTIRRRVRDRTLPVRRVGRSVRIDLSTLRPASEEEVDAAARIARIGSP